MPRRIGDKPQEKAVDTVEQRVAVDIGAEIVEGGFRLVYRLAQLLLLDAVLLHKLPRFVESTVGLGLGCAVGDGL